MNVVCAIYPNTNKISRKIILKLETWLKHTTFIRLTLMLSFVLSSIRIFLKAFQMHPLNRVTNVLWHFSQLTSHSQSHYFSKIRGTSKLMRGWELIRVIVLSRGKKVLSCKNVGSAYHVSVWIAKTKMSWRCSSRLGKHKYLKHVARWYILMQVKIMKHEIIFTRIAQ